ncbi:hypothetical protein HDV06_001677 [Boothiomyces sp. JEL0866]|nr:hypothetical protein HDV06_001677 [Boothiomyces sp. JEL0866]
MTVQEYHVGQCGNAGVMTSDCCYSSTNYELSKPFWSGTIKLPTSDIVSNLPANANSHKYCYLQSQNVTALNNYIFIYYHDNNMCFDGVICDQGNLQIYANPNCTGAVESFALSSKIVISSKALGYISAEYLTIQNALSQFSWVAATPSRYLTVLSKPTIIDYVCSICFGIALLEIIMVLGWHARLIICKKEKLLSLVTLSYIFWFVWVALSIIFTYTTFPDGVGMSWYAEVMQVVFNFATLTSVLITLKMIIAVYKMKQTTKYGSLIFILLLHFGFAGSNYVYYLVTTKNEPVSAWHEVSGAWIFFVFVFNFICPFLTSLKMVSNGLRGNVIDLLRFIPDLDYKTNIILILQSIFFVSYFVMELLSGFTDVIGGDAALLAMTGVNCFLLVSHTVLNQFLSQYFVEEIQNEQGYKENLASQSSLLV